MASVFKRSYHLQVQLISAILALCSCEEGGADCLLQLTGMQKELAQEAAAPEANPPQWPSSVYVFRAKDDQSQTNATLWRIFKQMGPVSTGKFSSARYAFLFEPGTYHLDVPVGYYTQVLGLGSAAEDVVFAGERGLFGPSEGDNNNFNTFWKAGENFANRPTSQRTVWSVSQAAPLRRVKVSGDLAFGTYNGSVPSEGSGGFIANVEVSGTLDLVRQQQWLIRNCEVAGRHYFQDPPRAVNFVYLGTQGAPQSTKYCTDAEENPVQPKPQEIRKDSTPVQLEKPYITITHSGRYKLHIPQPLESTRGTSWTSKTEIVADFDDVFVASNATSLALINAKLALGRHVILTPGIYHLSSPIRIGWNGTKHQVLLGLGMATLIPVAGTAAVDVGPAPGARVAGVLLQAGHKRSESLLYWSPGGDPKHPGLLADVFARVGGPDTVVVSAKTMFQVDGDHVILDNVWAWRADCCQDGCGTCVVRYCEHGVVVNGHHVTAYGLFSEHCRSDLVVWNGERGRTFFFQSEMDSFAREAWDKTPHYGQNGVSGYRINAEHHEAVGLGVYVYFTQSGNIVKAGVVVANNETIQHLDCPFYWNLNPTWYTNGESGILSAVRVARRPVMVESIKA